MALVESAVYQLKLVHFSVPAGFEIACPSEPNFNGVKDRRNGLFKPDLVSNPIRPVEIRSRKENDRG
jgi:hypothetical protein